MINANQPHKSCCLMKAFQSCHLIVFRTFSYDRRHIGDFIVADYICWMGISTPFCKWTPFTNVKKFISFLCSIWENLK